MVGATARARCAALGSVSLQVAMHAKSPVVVVRGHDAGSAGGPIVVGVDGSAISSDAVGYAYEQASLRGGAPSVVYAWWIEFIEGVVVTAPGRPVGRGPRSGSV